MSPRKCFTFIWKLENASYCWQRQSESIESPMFTVDEIHRTNWKLELRPSIERVNDEVGFFLQRHKDIKNVDCVNIDCDIAFLSSDGEILLSAFEKSNAQIIKKGSTGISNAAFSSDIFFARKSMFLPQDTLTVRCRMWNSVGEMSKDVHCFARTRIVVEKRSFLWNIENFSTLKRTEKMSHHIKSHDDSKNLMSLELSLTGGLFSEERIRFKIIPDYQNIKISTFQLSIVDAFKNTVKCFQDEFCFLDSCDTTDFTLFWTKNELLEKKGTFLPDDALSLSCECTFCFGTVHEEIENIDSDCNSRAKKKLENNSVGANKNEFSVPKCRLLDNLKSMFNNSCVSDVKLKTKSQTYPAHKCILSAQSPVFKAMFSNDMKEKLNECVDIEDLSDDTVLRLLRYIYSAEVEELDWESAIKLFEAADKYQILSLRDICSSFMKNNLSVDNACEALVLADLHQDENLKGFIQNFILRHGKDIINSEEWEKLAGTNVKLAFEIMRLKFNEQLNWSCGEDDAQLSKNSPLF